MAIRQKYKPLPSPAVVTIDYIDLAAPVTILNACTSEKSTGEQYFLTSGTPYSHLISISGALGVGNIVSGAFTSQKLNRPMVIKGTPYVNMTWKASGSSSSNYVFAQLRTFDGSTYTQLAEVSGAITDWGSGTMRTTLLQFPAITTPVIVKAGEQIDIKVGITGVTTSGTSRGHIACDPQNRDDDYFTTNNFDTTKLMLGLPTKLT